MHRPLSPLEVFGLSPLRERLAQAWLTLRGDESTPPSRFDHTSLKQLVRLPGPRVWAGQRIYDPGADPQPPPVHSSTTSA